MLDTRTKFVGHKIEIYCLTLSNNLKFVSNKLSPNPLSSVHMSKFSSLTENLANKVKPS